jgi:hypothetical protein
MTFIQLSPYRGVTTVMTTELNSLATLTGKALSPALANDDSQAPPTLDLFADLELAVDFVSAPTAGSVVELYLLPSIDGGTTYPDGSSSVTPQSSLFVGGFAVRGTSAAQIMVIRGIALPPGYYKYLVQNTTNQTFPAAGSRLRQNTYQLQTWG